MSIEKFSGTLRNDTKKGFTVIFTDVIQSIKNLETAGMYSYLASLPETWEININHLKNNFGIGDHKVYRIINALISMGLISRTEERKSGMFASYSYTLHISPLCRYPDAVHPDAVNGSTYKEKKLIKEIDNKKDLKTLGDSTNTPTETNLGLAFYPLIWENYQMSPRLMCGISQMDVVDLPNGCGEFPTPIPDSNLQIVNTDNKQDLKPLGDSTNTPSDYTKNDLFMLFYQNYPRKEKPREAYKAFLKLKPTDELVQMLLNDLTNRIANNWKGRDRSKIPHPSTYLNQREWEGEIFIAKEDPVKPKSKYKTMDEILPSHYSQMELEFNGTK